MSTSARTRTYIFADHASCGYPSGCHSRTEKRREYHPPAFTLAAIINRENLVRVFEDRRNRSGQGAGIDGFRFKHFSKTEFGDVADVVVEAIHSGRWRPRRSRVKKVPKDNGGTRDLNIRCIVDRTVSAAVSEEVISRIDPLLGEGCIGFRPGRCIHRMLAEIAYRAEFEGLTVLTQDDIQDAFPSVDIEHAVADYARHTIDPGLLRLIEVILRGHNQSRQSGIDQGDPLSPPTLNQRLHYCLDEPALGSASHDSTHRYRYVDDLVYQSRSVTEGCESLHFDRVLLDQARFSLKGRGNHPIDLRRRGARINTLGFNLSWSDSGMQFGLSRKAISKLAKAVEKVHEGPDPTEAAREVIHGWVEAQGPALESGGVPEILDSIQRVAAQAGLREVGKRVELEDWVGDALAHWRQVRGQVVQLIQRRDVPVSISLGAPPPSSGP